MKYLTKSPTAYFAWVPNILPKIAKGDFSIEKSMFAGILML